MAKVTLNPLTPDDREQFIRENQGAFNYGALEEFGLRDDHFEEDGEIISHETIEQAIDGGEAYLHIIIVKEEYRKKFQTCTVPESQNT